MMKSDEGPLSPDLLRRMDALVEASSNHILAAMVSRKGVAAEVYDPGTSDGLGQRDLAECRGC